jgi:hypothetical protein
LNYIKPIDSQGNDMVRALRISRRVIQKKKEEQQLKKRIEKIEKKISSK